MVDIYRWAWFDDSASRAGCIYREKLELTAALVNRTGNAVCIEYILPGWTSYTRYLTYMYPYWSDFLALYAYVSYIHTCTDIKVSQRIYVANQVNTFHITIIIIMRNMIIDNNINIYYFWSTCSTLQPLDHFFPFRFRYPVHRRPASCAGESLPVRLTKAPSHSSLIDAERRKKKATKKKEGDHVFLCRIFFFGMRLKWWPLTVGERADWETPAWPHIRWTNYVRT